MNIDQTEKLFIVLDMIGKAALCVVTALAFIALILFNLLNGLPQGGFWAMLAVGTSIAILVTGVKVVAVIWEAS